MTQINKKMPVLVTGATGYVAGRLVNRLLEAGLTVHAPVRDPNNLDKTRFLRQLAEELPGQIRFFEADLLDGGSYDEAMKGCELVFHTASPFSLQFKDAQKDLIDPALLGTRNVLGSVERTPTVKRVVLTSSCAAVLGDTVDLLSLPNGTATEEHWNSTSSLTHQPYSFSKTLAEKEAWHLNRAQNRWDLVVINPTLVLGPGINPRGTSESFHIFRQLGDGTMKSGVPDLDIGLVDVRDVAQAHYLAGFTPKAQGRHIVSAKSLTVLQMAQVLRSHYGDAYPFPQKQLPKWLVWLVGPLVGMPRKMVRRNVGYPWKVDHTKSKTELGLTYREPEEFLVEFFQQMIDHGTFQK
ncbi:MAG: NAD-dependent epimerase/dehydratase family protein [bacterium]|nr:NAD-dependent epimerase/dehydratase family protein [bacterium]